MHRNQEISVTRGCCPLAVELKKVVRSGWLVAPGGWCPGVRLDPIQLAAVPQGPRRCIGCRLAWPTKDAIQRTSLTGGRTRFKKGQSSQTAVSIDCGGVSAAMGSSDSDEDAFFVAGPFAYPLSCLLPVKKHPIKLVMACLLTNAATLSVCLTRSVCRGRTSIRTTRSTY